MSEKIKIGEKTIKVGKELGRGREKVVYTDPENEKVVKGIYHLYKKESIDQIKERYYLTKILHIIYPKNIPDLHLAASNPHMIIIDKVDSPLADGKEQLNKLGKDKYVDEDAVEDLNDISSEAYSRRWEIINRLLEFDIVIDEFPNNFTIDYDGNVKYIDTIDPWILDDPESPNFSYDKLKDLINSFQDGRYKKRALIYLERLNALNQSHISKTDKQ